MPFPMPRSVSLLANSMIVEDNPAHHRLRSSVNTAFKPGAIARIQERIERLTHELLDQAEKQGPVDLMPAYCLPIPTTVISELVGVSDEDMPRFGALMGALAQGGLSGWNRLHQFQLKL